MDPATLAAVAQVAYDAYSNHYNQNQVQGANSRSFAQNIWAMRAQQEFQERMMDKQNEYNKPINQMKRLREAGLNPNLVYGNANAIMASASPSGGSSFTSDVTPSTSKLEALGRMSMLKTLDKQDADIANMERQTRAIDDNLELKKQELELSKISTAIQTAIGNAQIRLANANAVNQEQNNKLYQDVGELFGSEDGSRAFTDLLGAAGKPIAKAVEMTIKSKLKGGG